MTDSERSKPSLGFWQCWGMAVGVMIGSGIFMLPTVLASYGSISLVGWLVTSVGAIVLALVLGRLSGRTTRTGGPYVYAQEAFGDLAGFLIAWGYWVSIVFAIAAVSAAFAGYLGSLIPSVGNSNFNQAMVAIIAIWVLAAINVRSVAGAASVQLTLTLLKLLPLLAVIALGVFAGESKNIPAFNLKQAPLIDAIAATALLTMWAFTGVEAAVVPAANVKNPTRTIPRAVVSAALAVAALYICVTIAVMMLVPYQQLVISHAPFVDASQKFGPWGSNLIAFGVLVATAGGLNGNILLSGQMPMAVALDGLAPKIFAKRNKGGASSFSLILSALIGSVLLIFNFTEGLVGAFTFLISMSTLAALSAYAVSALAELSHSWRNARAWGVIAIVSFMYTLLAALGSGLAVLAWGLLLFVVGLLIYFIFNRKRNDQLQT